MRILLNKLFGVICVLSLFSCDDNNIDRSKMLFVGAGYGQNPEVVVCNDGICQCKLGFSEDIDKNEYERLNYLLRNLQKIETKDMDYNVDLALYFWQGNEEWQIHADGVVFYFVNRIPESSRGGFEYSNFYISESETTELSNLIEKITIVGEDIRPLEMLVLCERGELTYPHLQEIPGS